MKKKDILISLAIIAVSGGVLYVYTHRTGYLQLDAGPAAATLELSGSLFNKTTVRSGQGPVAVRARIHRPRQLRLSIGRKDRHYLLESRGPWGEYSKIKVKHNETTIIQFGSPFLIQPAVHKHGPDMRLIDFSIIGRAGETYRYGNRASKPKVRIVDDQGNVLGSGSFSFG